MVKVFISHTHNDQKLTDALVGLLETTFEFSTDDLRCTSHESYGIDYGTDPVATLRNDLSNGCLVLAVFTHHTRQSAWVNAELGAAWITAQLTIPLLCGNMDWTSISGPLFAHARPMSLRMNDDILRLLKIIDEKVGWRSRLSHGSDKVRQKVKVLCEVASSVRVHFPPERIMLREELFTDEHLLRWIDIRDRKPDKVYIWGWSCLNTVGPENKEIFKTIVQHASELNFLALDAESAESAAEHIDFGVVCNRPTREVTADITSAFDNIETHLIHQLVPKEASRICRKTTDWFMAWSGVAIDPETDDGIIQIEFYHYQNPGDWDNPLYYRPNLVLTTASKFYIGFWKSFKQMWDEATVV